MPHRCLSQMWSLLEESERCCVVFTADHTPSCLSCCRSLLPCPEQADSPGVEAQVSVTAWPGAGQGASKVCVCGSLVVSGDNSGDHKALWTSFLHAFTQVVGLLFLSYSSVGPGNVGMCLGHPAGRAWMWTLPSRAGDQACHCGTMLLSGGWVSRRAWVVVVSLGTSGTGS